MGTATHFGPASHLSVYQDYEVLWEITENRSAGAAPGELGLQRFPGPTFLLLLRSIVNALSMYEVCC